MAGPAHLSLALQECKFFYNRAAVPHSNARSFSTESENDIDPSKIRNVAIIAHVDHGKTTLVDCILAETLAVQDATDRVMDSNDLEKERGITILSKSTSLFWTYPGDGEKYQINIVDTPGHADFGGEVERIMNMVDGVALLVDATEGAMTQTRFVLGKALQKGLKPIVVFNKADKPSRRIGEVEGEIFDLFDALEATDEQMDFPYVYTSAKDSWAVHDIDDEKKDLSPLLSTIIKHIPPPPISENPHFSMLVSQIDVHPFFGTLLTGRVHSGEITTGQAIHAIDPEGNIVDNMKLLKIFVRRGMEQVEVKRAFAGDIVSLAGFNTATVNYTLSAPDIKTPLPSQPIDPPTISMVFGLNSSPFAGQEGSQVTAPKISQRLQDELKTNVSLRMVPSPDGESFEVFARGELQLGILVETMRREGFELSLSPPRVVFKTAEDGRTVLEPMERLIVDIDQEHAPIVMEKLFARRAEMTDSSNGADGRARFEFLIPTRGLIGFRSEFTMDTRAQGVMNTAFDHYSEHRGDLGAVQKGALIAHEAGKATNYGIAAVEPRGTLFISTGMDIYEGMVVGEASRGDDVIVNPVRSKQLTNFRAAGKDEFVRNKPPRRMTLEDILSYVRPDELIEVTPKAVRLRKAILDPNERKRAKKSSKY